MTNEPGAASTDDDTAAQRSELGRCARGRAVAGVHRGVVVIHSEFGDNLAAMLGAGPPLAHSEIIGIERRR